MSSLGDHSPTLTDPLETVRARVLADPALQQELRGLDPETFVRRVVELAARLGTSVTPEAVDEALRRARLDWLERWI